MTIKITTLALAATMFLAGCSPTAAPGASATPAAGATTAQVGSPSGTPAASAPHAYALGSKKKGDMALCVVCAVNDGATAEEAAVETIDYEGKTYVFCNESEKAQFISSPTKFAAK